MRTGPQAAVPPHAPLILQYLEICDGNMEEGSFRCDANVSVRPAGRRRSAPRVEVKNMNSSLGRERDRLRIERQAAALAHGEPLPRRPACGTPSGRRPAHASKEFAHDYRLLSPSRSPAAGGRPEVGGRGARHAARATAPRRERFVRDYQLSTYDADVLTQRKDIADYFERGSLPAPCRRRWQLGHDRAPPASCTRRKLDDALGFATGRDADPVARLGVRPRSDHRNTAKALIPPAPRGRPRPQELVAAEGPPR